MNLLLYEIVARYFLRYCSEMFSKVTNKPEGLYFKGVRKCNSANLLTFTVSLLFIHSFVNINEADEGHILENKYFTDILHFTEEHRLVHLQTKFSLNFFLCSYSELFSLVSFYYLAFSNDLV